MHVFCAICYHSSREKKKTKNEKQKTINEYISNTDPFDSDIRYVVRAVRKLLPIFIFFFK